MSQPIRFKFKEKYDSIIPLRIYQTWETKEMPEKMRENVERLKERNPAFQHFLFDKDDRRAFIQRYFPGRILEAYDSLIPGAYQADLWRYCVLYINGGIYLDIKFRCVHGFRLIALTEREHFPCDVPPGEPEYQNEPYKGVWNGLLVCLPGNDRLMQAIHNICYNVKHRFYGKSSLSPTGPFLIGKYVPLEEKKNARVKRFMGEKFNGASLCGVPILTEYNEYRSEQNATTTHYNILWSQRKVYR